MGPTDMLSILLVLSLVGVAVFAWLLYRPGNAATRPPRARRPGPPARDAPPSRQSASALTPAPAPISHADSAPPPRLLDPHDPTVRLAQAVAAQYAQIAAAVRAIPPAFHDRAAMWVELQAIDQRLADIQEILARSDPSAYSAHRPTLRKVAERLTSIGLDAGHIAESLSNLAEREGALHQAAVALSDDLSQVARLAPYPLAVNQTAAAGARVLGRIARIPDRTAITSFNALKIRLQEAQELHGAIDQLRADLEQAQRRRTDLLALLGCPQLAEDAPWHRALAALHARSRAVGEGSLSQVYSAADLLADADELLARRRRLFDYCTPMDQGGVLLAEERLPALLAEAEAIRADVQSLWQRARLLIAEQRRGA